MHVYAIVIDHVIQYIMDRHIIYTLRYKSTCEESCTDPNADSDFIMLGMNATTLIARVAAEAPENLTVSNATARRFRKLECAYMPMYIYSHVEHTYNIDIGVF